MEKRLSRRREAFCRAFAAHGNAARAAREAGYEARTAYSQGNRLLKTPEVRARIEEIDAERAEAAAAERGRLTARLEDVCARAIERGALGVAVRAIEAEARIAGLALPRLPDSSASARHAATGRGGGSGLAANDDWHRAADEMDMAEIIARAEANLAQALAEDDGADDSLSRAPERGDLSRAPERGDDGTEPEAS